MKTLVSWSGGKDSAWMLDVLRREWPQAEIVGLVTTINECFDRIAMHGVRRELLVAQAEAADAPVWTVPLPWPCSNETYEARMRSLIAKAQEIGVEAFAFGDLFLTEIRAYRERQLAGTGIEPIFPIWGIPTQGLARAMICAGVRARLSCVDPKQISASFVGREFDENLLDELPAHADPCGENGEFPTFVYAGPMLRREVRIVSGETVTRDGFVYADLMLAQSTASSQAIA
jgi:uncharacterized protein (TIGR00290 family)